MAEAVLIGRPKIDFDNLFRISSQALGWTITTEIDNSLPLSEAAKLISALTEFSDGQPLFFLHYGFLCHANKDTAIKVREWTKLDITSNDSVDGNIIFFAAGTVDVWKQAVEACCSNLATFELRLLFDKILLLFEREGLGSIWFGQRKVMLQDKTFLLEEMK